MNIKLFYALTALSLTVACQHSASQSSTEKDSTRTDSSAKTALPPADTLSKVEVKIDCIDRGGDMENGFLQECIFHQAGLDEAYSLYRIRNTDNDDGKYLEPTLPKTDATKTFEESAITVKYTYNDVRSLTIDLLFPGGETTITLAKDSVGTKISTLHSPD
ncbi:MAG: hypothetical protein LBE37_12310 [Sphingobacterium sp.]|jgi:hypothetical protein|nr:hypothetical protein [Sphingobacterium sp.]